MQPSLAMSVGGEEESFGLTFVHREHGPLSPATGHSVPDPNETSTLGPVGSLQWGCCGCLGKGTREEATRNLAKGLAGMDDPHVFKNLPEEQKGMTDIQRKPFPDLQPLFPLL